MVVLWMPYSTPTPPSCARWVRCLAAAEADLAEQLDAGGGQLLEILLDLHLVFDHRRTGMHLHAAGAAASKRALGENRHRFQADHVARPSGHVDLARRNHGGDAAMQIAVDPAGLVLPRGPVAGDRVDMAVDQAGRDRGSVGIDHGGGAFGVDVLGAADRGDFAVFGQDRVGIQDRLFQHAAQQQADIADHQPGRAGGLGYLMGHGFCPFGSMPWNGVRRSDPGLTPGSSWIIHSYTNELRRANWPPCTRISRPNFPMDPAA